MEARARVWGNQAGGKCTSAGSRTIAPAVQFIPKIPIAAVQSLARLAPDHALAGERLTLGKPRWSNRG